MFHSAFGFTVLERRAKKQCAKSGVRDERQRVNGVGAGALTRAYPQAQTSTWTRRAALVCVCRHPTPRNHHESRYNRTPGRRDMSQKTIASSISVVAISGSFINNSPHDLAYVGTTRIHSRRRLGRGDCRVLVEIMTDDNLTFARASR